MATKAESWRYYEERSGPKKAKRPPSSRDDWPGGAFLALSPSEARIRKGRTASRNFSARAGREAAYDLEDSSSGRPSRRSTRKGANRMKPSHPQRSSKRNEALRRRFSR